MKKRVLSLVLTMAILLSFGAGIIPVAEATATMPSYGAADYYGTEVFSYYTRDITTGVNTQMTYNEGSKVYMVGATANVIGADYLSAGANPAVGSMLVFTAPYSGTVTISNARAEGLLNRGKLGQRTEYAACYATIYAPNWATLASYSIPAGPDPVATPDITSIRVTEGQQIRFLLGSNDPMNSYVIWSPVISYTATDHVWAEEWSSNETHHWHECTLDDCDITDVAEKNGYDIHADLNKDGACDSCNAAVAIHYNAKADYRTDAFGYYTRDITTGVNTPMTYNEGSKLYMVGATANYIGSDYLSVGANAAVGSMLVFTAPYSGTITISNGREEGLLNRGKLGQRTEYAACYATIYGTDWSTLASYSIPAGPDPVATPDITNIQVTAGQQIRFLLGSNTPMNSYVIWIPEITYTTNPHMHMWAEEWSSDETYHWHECIADNCDIIDNAEKDGYGIHADVDKNGACDVCSTAVAICYNAKTEYGTGAFGYFTRDITTGANTQMTFNEGAKLYMNGATANVIGSDYLSVGANPAIGSMLVFTAPYSGTITISNARAEGLLNRGKTGGRTEYAACYATIYGTDWSTLASYSIPAGADPVATPAIENIEVTAGQQIRFLLGSNDPMNSYVIWIPEITYTAVRHDHVWAEEWSSNDNYHWHECIAEDCGITDNAEKDGYAIHEDVNKDGACDVCSTAVAICYNAKTEYGTGAFGYFTRDITTGANTQMTFNESAKLYMVGATANYIGSDYYSVGANPAIGSMLVFTAPYSGTITISNGRAEGLLNRGKTGGRTEYAACYATIYGADWSTLASYSIPAGPDPVATPDITNIQVTEGQQIKFLVGSNDPMNSYVIWIPVITYTEVIDAKVDEWNVSLYDDIKLNFCLDIPAEYAAVTDVCVTVSGVPTTQKVTDLAVNKDGKYVVTAELAAAQMTEKVNVQILTNGQEVSKGTYSVRQYAEYILDDANGYSEQDKLMVQAMLHYGASAQAYFDIDPDNLADNGYTDSVTEDIPAVNDYNVTVSDSISGISFYGASLLFKDRIAVRFYFTVTGDGSYTVNGKTLTEKDGLWYVEFADIAPQDLDQIIEAVVSDENGSSFTVAYSPLHYIVRQYNKTENAELKDLVQNLYDYHKAAVAYVG